jgi:hypothetical protein
VYTAYARSPKTGWGIAFGIPRASVDAPLERSLLAIGAGGVAFAVLALALAALVGRRITAPMATWRTRRGTSARAERCTPTGPRA